MRTARQRNFSYASFRFAFFAPQSAIFASKASFAMNSMSKKHLLFELSMADYVTVLATFLIINSFWLAWHGEIKLAISVAFLSMFFDYFDGAIARKYGGSPYGKVLDSLYDVLGWVLFPALVVNIETGWAWWSVVTTTLFCLASVIRLSRFTVVGYVGKDKTYYTGLPVLFSKYALVVVLLSDAKLSVIILAVMVPLMVSSRPIRKPPPFTSYFELIFSALFLWFWLRNV
jgi:phosphatidylserine synthase